ncbi:MAG: hypothetical protein R3A13_03065 [Bdellovibrionota bacterium]
MSTKFTLLQIIDFLDTGDTMHRARWPAAQIALQDPDVRIISLPPASKERFEWAAKADILFLIQALDTRLLDVIRQRKAAGLTTIVEYNDNFYLPPHASSAASSWSSPEVHRTYEDFMLTADQVITTSEDLANLYKEKIGVEATILKNQFPYDPGEFKTVFKAAKSKLVIGWAGSLGHISDFLAFLPLLESFVSKHDNLEFWVMGNNAIPSYVKLPPNKFKFVPWGNMEQYFSFWKEVDIGISPMLDTPYNRCRSDVKAIEMSALGTLPVLQDFRMYQEFSQGSGIGLVENFSAIIESLEELLNNQDLIEARAKNAFDYVKQHRLGVANTSRLDYLKSVLGKTTGFNWKLPSGYHEVEGTRQETNPDLDALKQTEKLLHDKQLPKHLKSSIKRLNKILTIQISQLLKLSAC